MDKRITIRPIRQADIAAFYPGGLRDNCTGWAVELDGELAAVAGVSAARGAMVAFSRIKEGVRVSRRMIWSTAKRLNALIVALPYQVIYALTVNGRFMAALGWTWIETRGNVEVFQWIR